MPESMPVMVEIYTSFARKFKLGKQAEDALDGLSQLTQQAAQQDQKQPKPDPEAGGQQGGKRCGAVPVASVGGGTVGNRGLPGGEGLDVGLVELDGVNAEGVAAEHTVGVKPSDRRPPGGGREGPMEGNRRNAPTVPGLGEGALVPGHQHRLSRRFGQMDRHREPRGGRELGDRPIQGSADRVGGVG